MEEEGEASSRSMSSSTSGSQVVPGCGRQEISSFEEQLPLLFLEDGGRDLARFIAAEACPSHYCSQLAGDKAICAARSNAVHWMIKVRNVYGFSPLTVALSVSYFDRYLCKELRRRVWKAWMIELLSISCLSLAAKMEETSVPMLQDLQIEGLDHLFEPKTIQRMEVTVMKMLDWRMNSVTPFSYLEGLLYGIDITRQLRILLLNRITELLIGTLPEMEFVAYAPSVIALAATICALEEAVPLQAGAHRCTLAKILPLEEGKLNGCYKLMEELVVDPLYPMVSSSQVLENQGAGGDHGGGVSGVGDDGKSPADVVAANISQAGKLWKNRGVRDGTATNSSSSNHCSTSTTNTTRSKRKLDEFLCKEDL